MRLVLFWEPVARVGWVARVALVVLVVQMRLVALVVLAQPVARVGWWLLVV
jgi:hypothetical protein